MAIGPAQVPIPNSSASLWLSPDVSDTLHACLAPAGTGAAMLQLSKNVRTVIDPDGAILLDLLEGKMLRCNRTGATILELLLRRYDQDEITAEFRRRYQLPPDSAEADVRAFLMSLQNQGLLRQETDRKPEE